VPLAEISFVPADADLTSADLTIANLSSDNLSDANLPPRCGLRPTNPSAVTPVIDLGSAPMTI
jgi:uncharacterized protein YjbI with pentapeptide repeats